MKYSYLDDFERQGWDRHCKRQRLTAALSHQCQVNTAALVCTERDRLRPVGLNIYNPLTDAEIPTIRKHKVNYIV